jgi:hypothetical protein
MVILMKVKNKEAPESKTKKCIFPSKLVVGVVEIVMGRFIVLIGSSQQGQTVIFYPF